MPFHSLIRQVEGTCYCHPLKRLAAKILSVIGVFIAVPLIGRLHFFSASSIILRVGDDDIVLSVELVHRCGILFIDEVLFLEFKFELVLIIWLHWHKSNTNLHNGYNSSQPLRWFSILTMGISLAQLFQDPTRSRPSIKRQELIFI